MINDLATYKTKAPNSCVWGIVLLLGVSCLARII